MGPGEVAALSALAEYLFKFGLTGGAFAVLFALHKGYLITKTHYDEVKAAWQREITYRDEELKYARAEHKAAADLLLRSARVTSQAAQAVNQLADSSGVN